jgi:hypothetical protein
MRGVPRTMASRIWHARRRARAVADVLAVLARIARVLPSHDPPGGQQTRPASVRVLSTRARGGAVNRDLKAERDRARKRARYAERLARQLASYITHHGLRCAGSHACTCGLADALAHVVKFPFPRG